MPVIDAQVHAYERNHVGRPWHEALPGPDEVTGDDMVAAMDAVGVDAALLISPFAMYRYDGSYAQEVFALHSRRFRLIKPVDATDPAVGEIISDWAATPGAIGVRLMLGRGGTPANPADAGLQTVMKACAEHGLPLNVLGWGVLDQVAEMVRREPNTQFVLDHLGIPQPFTLPIPTHPFAELEQVLALAEFDNLAIKITGACTLSHKAYPFEDIWPPLEQIFATFGLQRCLWGTDWTRAMNIITYRDGVQPFVETDRLSEADRLMLMSGALERIYGWSPAANDE